MPTTESSFTQDLFKAFGVIPHDDQWIIAFSGGLDSSVLLHAAASYIKQKAQENTAEKTPSLLACHVDHQLADEHLQWVEHCRHTCETLEVPFVLKTVQLKDVNSCGLEAAARKSRYEALAELVQNGESCVLTGHHEDDQAETLLNRLARGTGPQSFRGVHYSRRLGHGELRRPLLSFSRDELLAYAAQHNLQWIEDPSNQDTRFDRNFVRHEIMPKLHERWPQFSKRAAASALALSEQLDFLDEIAIEDVEGRSRHQDHCGSYLCLSGIADLHAARVRNLLRRWCHRQGLVSLNSQQWQQLLNMVCGSTNAGQRELGTAELLLSDDQGQNQVLVVYDNKLFIKRELDASQLEQDIANIELVLDTGQTEKLFLMATKATLKVSSSPDKLNSSNWSLLPRLQGANYSWRSSDGVKSIKMNGQTKSLKTLFQSARVPAWLRGSYPVLFINNEAALVPGIAAADFMSETLNNCPQFDTDGTKIQRFICWSFP